MTKTRCVNDTNGDGDCAQCARNPQAPCRMPIDACDGCRLTGRCAEHPANGRLSLVDCATEFRERYGDDAEDAALKLFLRPLPAHDWRFMVEYGPHPDGDPRNGRVTFHDGATAEHVAAHLEREHIVLKAVCAGCGIAPCEDGRCACPKPDPYAHLSDDERRHLAVHARAIADMYGAERFNSASSKYSRRWREIADGLHANQGVTDASR